MDRAYEWCFPYTFMHQISPWKITALNANMSTRFTILNLFHIQQQLQQKRVSFDDDLCDDMDSTSSRMCHKIYIISSWP